MNIFIIGFMGSGKSTIAKILSERTKMEYVETDAMIVGQEGKSIADIFETDGEDYFRDVETGILKQLEGQLDGKIVSCGGGIVLRKQNVESMKRNGRIVLLTAEPDSILERVRSSRERPILNDHMNVPYIRGLMEKREPYYRAAADFVVRTDGKSKEEIVREILELMG
ncbi:shikimate kinase [Anaerolentibacter hominis]|uniref:shikimate kinase n=1 Tax=Anaerolentibacter hominis TaxID=3079009 RepID=UPI0031B8A4C7